MKPNRGKGINYQPNPFSCHIVQVGSSKLYRKIKWIKHIQYEPSNKSFHSFSVPQPVSANHASERHKHPGERRLNLEGSIVINRSYRIKWRKGSVLGCFLNWRGSFPPKVLRDRPNTTLKQKSLQESHIYYISTHTCKHNTFRSLFRSISLWPLFWPHTTKTRLDCSSSFAD